MADHGEAIGLDSKYAMAQCARGLFPKDNNCGPAGGSEPVGLYPKTALNEYERRHHGGGRGIPRLAR